MSSKENPGSRSKPSYAYSILSMSLVLFVLGLLGIVILNARKVTNQIKENLQINVIFKNDVTDEEGENLGKKLQAEPFVKNVEFINKEQAAKDFSKEFGHDFVGLLEYNPLFSSLAINLKADYFTTEKIKEIEKKLSSDERVQEVYYQRSLLNVINSNINKVGILLVILGGLFFLVALTLVDQTIRLVMYSNRFLIKSMQLVGATRELITKPFMRRSLLNGLISGLIAVIGITGVYLFLDNNIPELLLRNDLNQYLIIAVIILFLGVAVSWWSTRSAVLKYLKLKLEDLY